MATDSLNSSSMRILAVAATFVLSGVAGAQVTPAKAGRCAAAVTQASITECFTQEARTADAALKDAYTRVFAGSNAKRRTLLRASQRAWLSYRDAYCRYDALQYEGGSQYASELAACFAELADTRREELLSDYSAEREAGGSAPRGK